MRFAAVQEVVPLPVLLQPPGLPPILAGVFNLGGRSVAVIKLSKLFADAESPARRYWPLVVLRGGEPRLALLVDQAVGIASIVANDILPLGDNASFNQCADGIAAINDRRTIIISPDCLLTKVEQQRLADSAALEQARLAIMEGAAR
jgi:purine-binding chemotaxis protein CheW